MRHFLLPAALAALLAAGCTPAVSEEDAALKPRIVVLTEDGIAEEGSHDDLLKKGGIYADMYNLTI